MLRVTSDSYVEVPLIDAAIFDYVEGEVPFFTEAKLIASRFERNLQDVADPFCSPKILFHAVLLRLSVWWHEVVMEQELRGCNLYEAFVSEVCCCAGMSGY